MKYANDITGIGMNSMAEIRAMLTTDRAEEIRRKRENEKAVINTQLHGLQGPPKYWTHPNAHLLAPYWGSKNAY